MLQSTSFPPLKDGRVCVAPGMQAVLFFDEMLTFNCFQQRNVFLHLLVEKCVCFLL